MPRRSAAAAALRSPRPGPSPPGPSPGSRPLVRSPGTALTPPRQGCRSWCPTCPSVPASRLASSAGPPGPRQRPFGPGHDPYPAGYAGATGGGASITVPVSRCLSAAGIRFSGLPAPAGELSLPHVRPTGRPACRTPTGLSRSAWSRCDRGGCRLDPGDGGSLPAGRWTPASTCRLPAAVPVLPPPASRLQEST